MTDGQNIKPSSPWPLIVNHPKRVTDGVSMGNNYGNPLVCRDTLGFARNCRYGSESVSLNTPRNPPLSDYAVVYRVNIIPLLTTDLAVIQPIVFDGDRITSQPESALG